MGMSDIKKIETVVLHTIIAAHSSYCAKALTADEAANCKTIICRIQNEIASRSANKKKIESTVMNAAIHQKC